MTRRLIFSILFLEGLGAADRRSLSGTVVDSVTGRPLDKVELHLEPAGSRSSAVASTETDAEGRFAFLDLDPGRYRLKGRRNGYLEMFYGARRPESGGTLLRLEPDQSLAGLSFRLAPAAVIAGTVRDADGEPLAGAHVILGRFTNRYGSARVEGLDSTGTDDRGEYRFHSLAAGKYYIGVEPRAGWAEQAGRSRNRGPAEGLVPTLYPGVPQVEMASPVVVSAGAHAAGVDVTVLRSRVFRVSGRVLNVPEAGRLALVLRDVKNAGMRDIDLRSSVSNASGGFEFHAVPPGFYELDAEGTDLCGRASVMVAASDVDGVELRLAPGAEIRLHIVAEGFRKPDLSSFGFFVTRNGRTGFRPLPWEKEKFTIRNVPPDRYALQFSGNLLRQFYVKAARTEGTDVLRDGLPVPAPGTIDIEVVLAPDGGVVRGVVLDRDGRTVSGATVLLAPDQRSRSDLFKTAATDQSGRFELTAIASGPYKLFAWEDAEPGIWNDPEYLKQYETQGRKLVIEPNSQSAADLRLAVRSDTR